ncbi:MAG TPA: SUMF1/EgtB/PvdO family nonheme iron enzyme [Burkholderiaceae bacterium]|nr:SUMF1/EgtB/PvdO family nonheme iron enzyme [Burkholderiaceae bacterium]
MDNNRLATRNGASRFLAVGMLMAVVTLAACTPNQQRAPASDAVGSTGPALAVVPPGQLDYYPAGEYLRNGFPAVPPMTTVHFEQGVLIAQRQVSQAEYAECVRDGACKPSEWADQYSGDAAANLPITGVSWRDATDYAAWLSKKTGVKYRLPTYAEWVYAAGSAYIEDTLMEEFDASNPAQRWLAEYKLETQRKKTVDAVLRAFGGFGTNEFGLEDVAGNVWEWTDTCHVRQYLDVGDALSFQGSENCGVRVVAGAHRSYIPDFIRDAKSGACSVGVPPSNLGFRLVRDLGAQSTGALLSQG